LSDRARVLIVDDEPELVEILREHFDAQYDVSTALSGAAAVERFVRERPHVIFLDVNMPGITGVDVFKLVRQADTNVPVVIMTANEEIAVAEACLRNGALAFGCPRAHNPYVDLHRSSGITGRRTAR
jgi:two-component system, NtrC family, response regulator GlrR